MFGLPEFLCPLLMTHPFLVVQHLQFRCAVPLWGSFYFFTFTQLWGGDLKTFLCPLQGEGMGEKCVGGHSYCNSLWLDGGLDHNEQFLVSSLALFSAQSFN